MHLPVVSLAQPFHVERCRAGIAARVMRLNRGITTDETGIPLEDAGADSAADAFVSVRGVAIGSLPARVAIELRALIVEAGPSRGGAPFRALAV